MCFTGLCPYEQYMGDCTINDGQYPDDAGCVYPHDITKKEREEKDYDESIST